MKNTILENKLKTYIKKVILESRTEITVKDLSDDILNLLKKIKLPTNKITKITETDKFIELKFAGVLFDSTTLTILGKSDVFGHLACLKDGSELTLNK